MNRPGVLAFQGSPSRVPSVMPLNLPPSKSLLIRRIFICAVQGQDQPMVEWDSTWPQDVMDAWSLVQCYRFRRQQSQHQLLDHLWEAGEAGTVMRFGLAFLVAQGCGGILRGSGRAHERPIGDLVEALVTCGANIEYLKERGYPPLKIHPASMSRRNLLMKADTSSQFISAMAMVAPLLPAVDALQKNEPWVIAWSPQSVSSRPYLAMTIQEMSEFGYFFEYSDHSLCYLPDNEIQGQALQSVFESSIQGPWFVEGDWSAASFWIWRQAEIPIAHRLELKYLADASHQADAVILDLLARLAPSLTFSYSPDSRTWAFDALDMRSMSSDRADELPNDQDHSWINWNQGVWRIKATDFPDMVPALAMWAILSGKAVEIIGIGQLRYKESDRIQALMVNLDLLGIPYEPCDSDGLVIRPLAPWLVYSRRFVTPSELKGQRVATSPLLCCFGDHRMAMALSMLVLPDLSILMDAPQTVSKSYPRFWEDWAQFGYTLKALN